MMNEWKRATEYMLDQCDIREMYYYDVIEIMREEIKKAVYEVDIDIFNMLNGNGKLTYDIKELLSQSREKALEKRGIK